MEQPSAARVLAAAAGHLGETESPPGSNRVVFNTAYYGRPVSGPAYPWCCVFQWYVFREAGASALFFGGERTASCTALYRWYRQRGQAVPAEQARPGDLVFFVFDGNSGGVMNHVGLCEEAGGGYVTTIDGNTGDNQADGGAVLRRRRALKYVGGVARPAYGEEDDMTQEQFDAMLERALAARAAREPGPWSAEARAWAEAAGVINGGDGGKRYGGFCTREELAQALYNLGGRNA